MRTWLHLLAFTFAWSLAVQPVLGQPPGQPPKKVTAPAPQDLTIRGQIVKVEGSDRFIVRTPENKEVVFFANPQTRYVINGKAGQFADIRIGTDINAVYIVRDNRYWVNTVTVGAPVVDQAGGNIPQGPTFTVRGKILQIPTPDQFILQMADGKEATFFVTPQSRFLINGQAVKFGDLRTGAEVTAVYHFVVNSVTLEEALAPAKGVPDEGTLIQGTVVRTVGEDQVVVRTADNKEVIVYVAPQTKYVFGEQPGRFTDFRTGADIRVYYDVRDQRNVARSIIGFVRKN